jgi:beta-glucosidase
MQLAAPEGVEIEYMTGFDINGVDKNMDQVIEAAKNYDAVVVCIGEHVYSECKYIKQYIFIS